MKPVFRASYSVLEVWDSGNWERAIEMYFKLKKFETREMADGKKWHDDWRDHTNSTKCLPVQFGNTPLVNPICELKKVVKLADWLDLVGVIDCLDAPTIHEYKTGVQSSETYANSKQGAVYGVLATYSDIFVDRVDIHHFNQYSQKSDFSRVWLTDAVLKYGLNWIETVASEMYDYFTKNNLFERFAIKNLEPKP
jgi:hypothetical protein